MTKKTEAPATPEPAIDPAREVKAAVADRPAPDPPNIPQATQTLIRRDDAMATAFQGLVPSSIGEALQLAQTLARGKAIPKSFEGQPESVFTVIMAGMEIGLTPIRALQSIAVISGSLAMKADLQLAQARRSGALDFYDEGFEFRGGSGEDEAAGTDHTLKARLIRRGRTTVEQDELADLADTIIDLTEQVPPGRPYGWAIAQRKGDQKQLRVFSWLDAERFKYSEWEGPDSNRRKVDKKLSEKPAYVNNPQDMYPKRARVRVLQMTHSDVLAGMPAIEAMEGTYIDAEVIASEPATMSTEDAIAAELNAMKVNYQAEAATIEAGMNQLSMGLAKRLQKLKEYRANPAGLVDWLKTEYANIHSKGGRARPDVLGDQQPAATDTKQPNAETKPANGGTKTQQPGTEQPKAETAEPAVTQVAAPSEAGNKIRAIADRFKSMPSF